MTFKKGDTVKHRAFKKTGIIIKVLSPSRYLLQLGNLQIDCKEEELKSLKTTKKAKDKSTITISTKKKQSKTKEARLDLHGLNKEEARERIINFISDCIMRNVEKLEIVHGIGSGALKNTLHDYLKSANIAGKFYVHENNPGATIIWL